MLVIDCCIRGDESATRRYYQAYLDTLPASTQVTVLNHNTFWCTGGTGSINDIGKGINWKLPIKICYIFIRF